MGRTREALDDAATRFIQEQQVFFVASAPLDAMGHVNLSPKGQDTFRILSPTTVAYLDFNGSGVETIAHLKENGRIVLMFCAFQGRAEYSAVCMVMGGSVEPRESEFAGLLAEFPAYESVRSIIVVEILRVNDSCGYGVPFFKYEGEREQLAAWARKKGPDGLKAVPAGEEPAEFGWAAGSGGVGFAGSSCSACLAALGGKAQAGRPIRVAPSMTNSLFKSLSKETE